MPGYGLGTNRSGVIVRRDIMDILDPFGDVMSTNGYIGHQICPIYPVSKPYGEFPQRLYGNYFKKVDTKIAEDGTANRISVSIGGADYKTRPYALEFALADWTAEEYRDVWDITREGIRNLQFQHALNYETTIADLLQASTTYSNSWQSRVAGGGTPKAWTDPTADIIGDVEAVARQRDGKVPDANVMVCSRAVYRQLLHNQGILARISSGGAGQSTVPSSITKNLIADILGLDEIIVGDGKVDNNAETAKGTANNDAVLNLSPIWSNSTVQIGCAIKAGEKPSFSRPSFGYTIQWTRSSFGKPEFVEEYYEDRTSSRIFRIKTNYDIKVTGNLAWSQITGVWA